MVLPNQVVSSADALKDFVPDSESAAVRGTGDICLTRRNLMNASIQEMGRMRFSRTWRRNSLVAPLASPTNDNRLARCLLLIVILSCWAFLLPRYAHAQTATTGSINGTISDPSGAPAPGAQIVIKDLATGREFNTSTDAAGYFRVSLLPPAKYSIVVTASGFKVLTITDAVVEITETTSVNGRLQLGTNSESVTVTGTPPLLQTENPTIGRVIDHDSIVGLPLVNRNYTQILGLTSGTNTDVVDATSLGNGSQEIRANGARSGDNNFMINGVDANSYGANITEVTAFGAGGIAIPAPDSIQEFKVQTSMYDAEYGRGAGANVNIETRSGTAQFHGSVYYFGRNEALDANNFFAKQTGSPRGKFRRIQPGGTFGGPLSISKKRAFFFVSYQGTRDVNGASLASSVRSLNLPPIPLVRTRAALGAIFGGQSGAFGGAAVAPDGSNISQVALNLLNAKNPGGSFVIPSPQLAGSGLNYTAAVPGHYNEDQFNSNVDFDLRPLDHLAVKFFFSNSDQNIPFFGANVPGFPSLRSYTNRNLSAAETHIFSPQMVNQFRFGFTRIAGNSAAGGTLTDADVGINRFSDPQERIIPNISVAGAFQIGNSSNDEGKTANNNFYLSDTLSLEHGKHGFRFGVDVFRNQWNETLDFTAGSLFMLSFPDFLLGMSAAENGTPVSNVFLTSVSAGIPHIGLRSTATHVFALDDWKLSSHLTLNFGVRLEANGPQTEVQGRLSNFFPQFYVPPPPGGSTSPQTSGWAIADNYSGPLPNGFPRVNPAVLNNPWNIHPEPRVGLVWSPRSSLVVRSGYGIYANRTSFEQTGAQLIFDPPFTMAISTAAGLNSLATFQNPFPNLPPNSSFPNFISTELPGPPFGPGAILQTQSPTAPDFKESTVQQYTVEIQQSYKSFVFSVGYAGAKGTHLIYGRSNNQAILASPANPINGDTTNSVANAAERAPFVGLAPLQFRVESGANSNYNSLQVNVKKIMSHGFQIMSAYTYAKSIDDASDNLGSAAFGAFGVPIVGQMVFNDQNNPRAQHGLSDFDRRHRLVTSYVWNIPSKHINGSSLDKIAKGWSVSGVVTLQSGLPFSIFDSGGGTLFGSSTLYFTGSLTPGQTLAGAVRKGPVSNRLNEYFNTSAFTFAPFAKDGSLINGQFPVSGGGGTLFGNLGRNILRGPKQTDIDLALIKETPITEKVNFVFRWEFFNAFNTPSFANPISDIQAGSSFGVITGLTVNPRIMQFGAKLQF
jgi:hypothetical protein